MKKTIIAILGLSLVLAVFGLVSIMGNGSKSNAINTIGTERAKEIAFASSGYSANEAREISVEFEKANGRDIYEVEFEINNLDFDYFIDAYTGAIIESKIPTVSAQAQAMANANSKTENNTETHHTTHHTEENHSSTEQQHHNTQTAPQASTQPTQNPQPQTTPAPQQSTQTTVSSANNTTPAQDTQSSATPTAPQNNATNTSTPTGIISEKEAKSLVLARVPGASSSNFTKFNLDFDDGRYEYEGELVFNEMEYEFEIDAYSGSFRDWDAESVHD